MQGLLLNNHTLKSKKLKKLKEKILFIKNYANLRNIKLVDLCMSFVNSYKINKFVIGLNDLRNFKEVLNYKKIKKINFMQFILLEKKLIDPRFWNYEKNKQ